VRTHTIPSQVTTIEDRIAGNLSLTQILLLILPILLCIAVYAFFPPLSQLTILKTSMCFCVFFFSGTLAIRIKDKLILDWTIILSRFLLRPERYVFTKNCILEREYYPPEKLLKPRKTTTKPKTERSKQTSLLTQEIIELDQLLNRHNVALRFASNKQGGIDVVMD
jgi:hypothetical protein